MNKFYLLTIFLFFYGTANAQISQGGLPLSFTHSSPELNTIIELGKPTHVIDVEMGKKVGNPLHFATFIKTDIDILTHGQWDEINNTPVWRLKIKAHEAKGVNLYFDTFDIPRNGKLFIYDEDKTQVIGAFTSFNNHKSELFATEIINNSSVIIEYLHYGDELPRLSIDKIGYSYKDINGGGAFGSSAYCQVNANCSEGDDWQEQSRSVCRLIIPDGNFIGFCSGAAINNTDEDCTPYILSADHCFDGDDITTSDLNQTVFYFNYESSSCDNPNNEPNSNTMTGCMKIANSGGGGGSGDSDFFLVELNNNIPANYGVYMSGWDRSNTGATSGVSIHHPSGDIKKISTFTSTLTSASGLGWGNNNTTHWRVTWSETENGHGVTEGGSSGSPIFNNEGLIVGKLTGGSSYCNATNQPDVYGKMWYSWDQNGFSNNRRLKPWLAPSDPNTMTLENKLCGTNLNAGFSASQHTIGPGGCVTFSNNSEGDPNNFTWTFIGGSPSFASGEGPHTVCYNNAGNYTVILTVSDVEGNTDMLTEVGYITVDPNHNNSIFESEFSHEIILYPNPTEGILTVSILENYFNNNILVYDMLGNLVFETISYSLNTNLDLSNLKKGLYFMEISSSKEKALKKFILN